MRRFSRHSFGVRNRSPWRRMVSHAIHQFHENDLFTSAAAMSYFGLMTLFPALLLLLALSNRIAAGNEMITHIVQVYPGSGKFLRATISSLSNISQGVMITCGLVVLWAGSWVFAVVERALNRIWGTTPRTFLHGRALTLGMIGIVGVILSVWLVAPRCWWLYRKSPAGCHRDSWRITACCPRSAACSGRLSLP